MEKKVNRLLSVFSGGLSLGTIPSHSVFFVGQAFVPSVVSGSKLWWSDDSSFSLIRRFMRDYQHGGTIFLSGIDWVDLLAMCTDLTDRQHSGSKD